MGHNAATLAAWAAVTKATRNAATRELVLATVGAWALAGKL